VIFELVTKSNRSDHSFAALVRVLKHI